jgi:predicted ester cyclase
MSAEENKELIRRYVEEIYNKKDLTNYAEYVSDGILDFGIDHLDQFFNAFPDSRTSVLDLFGEGEKIIARLDIHGTNTGSFSGQPPTGKEVNFESYRIYRIVDRKIVESWAMQDRLGLMEQLGFVQSASDNVNWGSTDED